MVKANGDHEMKFTKFYISILYFVVIITSITFYVNNYYIIASLLIIGNILPGYKLALSMVEND